MQIAIRNLSKAYGVLWALKDINLEFRGGECVALLGPNGAGKTTLLKLLSALVSPTAGEIGVDGEKLNQNSSRLRSSLGFLSPNNHLYESLTVRENLSFFNSLYGKKKTAADTDEALESVGLLRWGDDFVSSLSSGMKCRLSIAKWTLLEPKILFLDEPYGVLDANGSHLLDSYLGTLCANGGTVIMATHHVDRILKICTRAVILHQGRIIFDEPRQEPWESFHRAFGEFLPRK